MTPTSFTKYLVTLPGVSGSLLLTEDGEVTSREFSEDLGENVLKNTVTYGRQLLATFQDLMPDATEACLQFSRQIVYLQDLGSHFVVLFLSDIEHMVTIRLSVNHAKHQVKLLGRTLISSTEQETPEEDTARYEIKKMIGEGGSAIVYKAWDRRFKRHVAMKRFNEESVNRNAADSDYESEVSTISQISHPNVVRAYDLDKDENGPFMILELVKGQNFETCMEENQLMKLKDLRPLVVQTFEALSAVHHAGFLHLDLKPSNLMVTESSSGSQRYTLIDFGRACDSDREKARREEGDKESLLGSIHYMAPEQLTKAPLDERTDLYAAGILIYEALTGLRPFVGKNTMEVIGSHLIGKPTALETLRPDLPEELCSWVMGLLATSADKRPESANTALHAFNELSLLSFDREEKKEAVESDAAQQDFSFSAAS